jgi:hypothetical protein
VAGWAVVFVLGGSDFLQPEIAAAATPTNRRVEVESANARRDRRGEAGGGAESITAAFDDRSQEVQGDLPSLSRSAPA